MSVLSITSKLSHEKLTIAFLNMICLATSVSPFIVLPTSEIIEELYSVKIKNKI